MSFTQELPIYFYHVNTTWGELSSVGGLDFNPYYHKSLGEPSNTYEFNKNKKDYKTVRAFVSVVSTIKENFNIYISQVREEDYGITHYFTINAIEVGDEPVDSDEIELLIWVVKIYDS